MEEVHEFVVFAFREGVDPDTQLETMRALDPYLEALDGFVAREYFYGGGRWVDHVTWESMAAALASESVLEDPDVAALFGRFDRKSVDFGRYLRLGS